MTRSLRSRLFLCLSVFEVPIMRILHVEDDEDTRTLVAVIVEAEGWEVVSVDNPREAMSLASGGGFDLFLLDNRLEGDKNNTLCRGIRSHDPQTPILFYSGAVFPSDVQAALASGAQGYLEKPSTPEDLVQAILKVTRQ
jgi:CheY-like chemotaxis protein